MKKMLLCASLFVFIVIIGVSVYAVINIASLDSEPTGVSDNKNAPLTQIEQYAAENYSEYDAQFDAQSKTLTLKKKTSFSLASASSIYTNPLSYFEQTQIFALDISLACNEPDLIVVLTYLSKDNEPMLSVSSNVEITLHWN